MTAVPGFLLLGYVLYDVVWTSLADSGGSGPVTARVTRWLWNRLRPPARARERHTRARALGETPTDVVVTVTSV